MAAKTQDELVALTDFQLAQRTYALVSRVMELDPYLTDELYCVTTEVFERFAPDAERADFESRHADDANRDFEIESSLDAMERRARLRREVNVHGL